MNELLDSVLYYIVIVAAISFTINNIRHIRKSSERIKQSQEELIKFQRHAALQRVGLLETADYVWQIPLYMANKL